MEIPARIRRRTLTLLQLFEDRRLVLFQRLGNRPEMRGKLGVIGLRRQRLRPMQREVEMAGPCVVLPDLPLR